MDLSLAIHTCVDSPKKAETPPTDVYIPPILTLPRHSRSHHVIPVLSHPVIPSKAGIQTVAAKLVSRNQLQTPANGSPLPLWERARVRARRAQARLCGRDARAPIPVLARHSRSLPPSFPRKRESRRSQPSSLPEINYKPQPTDPLSLYGRGLG